MSQDKASPTQAAHVIVFFVDNEEVATTDRTLTVAQILELSHNTPVEDFYLNEYRGQSEQTIRHDDLTTIIHIHPGHRFAAGYRGPTPVS